MKVTLIDPIATASGSICRRDDVYVRMLNGVCILQHKPRVLSPKRRAACQAFGLRYGTSRRKPP